MGKKEKLTEEKLKELEVELGNEYQIFRKEIFDSMNELETYEVSDIGNLVLSMNEYLNELSELSTLKNIINKSIELANSNILEYREKFLLDGDKLCDNLLSNSDKIISIYGFVYFISIFLTKSLSEYLLLFNYLSLASITGFWISYKISISDIRKFVLKEQINDYELVKKLFQLQVDYIDKSIHDYKLLLEKQKETFLRLLPLSNTEQLDFKLEDIKSIEIMDTGNNYTRKKRK